MQQTIFVTASCIQNSYARHLLMNGISINYLSRWLGHSLIQTTFIQCNPDTTPFRRRHAVRSIQSFRDVFDTGLRTDQSLPRKLAMLGARRYALSLNIWKYFKMTRYLFDPPDAGGLVDGVG